jgi:hypothetical protein
MSRSKPYRVMEYLDESASTVVGWCFLAAFEYAKWKKSPTSSSSVVYGHCVIGGMEGNAEMGRVACARLWDYFHEVPGLPRKLSTAADLETTFKVASDHPALSSDGRSSSGSEAGGSEAATSSHVSEQYSAHVALERLGWRVEIRSPPGTRRSRKSLMYELSPEHRISSQQLVEMLNDLGFDGKKWQVDGGPIRATGENPHAPGELAVRWLHRWGIRPSKRWLAQHPSIRFPEESTSEGSVSDPGLAGLVDQLVASCADAIRDAVKSRRTPQTCAFITAKREGVSLEVRDLSPDATGPIADRARSLVGPDSVPVLVFDVVNGRTFVARILA